MENSQDKKEFSVELNKDVASGNYSNFALIAHSSSEFIIDFARLLPGLPKAEVATRVIMTPENTKRLLMALKFNIENFEKQHGEIKLNDPGEVNMPMGFGSNSAEA